MNIRIEIRLTPAMAAATLNGLSDLATTNRSAAAAFERVKAAAMNAGHMVEFDGEKYRVRSANAEAMG